MKFAIQMEPETLLGQTVTHIMSRIYIHNYVYKNVFHNLLWYTLLILLNILCIYNYVYRNVFHSLLWYTLLVLLKYFRDCSFCSKRPHQQLYHNHESSLSSMPGNELSQNLARSPLPILTTVLTLITGGQYCHKVVVVPGYVRFYPLKPQPSYYLSCNALLKAWRSRTPRRPICFVAKLSSKQQDCDPHSATHILPLLSTESSFWHYQFFFPEPISWGQTLLGNILALKSELISLVLTIQPYVVAFLSTIVVWLQSCVSMAALPLLSIFLYSVAALGKCKGST